MGVVLGCMSSQFFSCLASLGCSCCCKACSAFKITGSVGTRLSYAGMLLLNSTVAYAMTTKWGIEFVKRVSWGFIDLKCPEGLCYGTIAVHRMCFSLTVWHIILGALTTGVYDSRHPRAKIQNGYWGFKFVGWVVLVALSFFLPGGFFHFYSKYVAMIGASIFLLIQLVLLVDFAYNIAEGCIERWEETERVFWRNLLVAGTTVVYLGFVALTTIDYVFFAARGCSRNQFFITVNMVLCIAISVMAIHPKIQEANMRSGLAQAGMVSIYASYLVTSALIGSPDKDDENVVCNPWDKQAASRITMAVIGGLFTIFAICYSTTNAAVKSNTLINTSEYEPLSTTEDSAVPLDATNSNAQLRNNVLRDAVASGALPASALEEGGDDESETDDDEKFGVQYNYTFFHFIFCMASMYVAMLLTNWNSIDPNSDKVIIIGKSNGAVWFKVISSWICIVLYAWTMIGPVVLPDREWS